MLTVPQATPSIQYPQTHLLGLPGELRNRIYRYVLVSDETIHIDPDCFQQPALLRTCTQVRNETSSIYYKENDFEFEVLEFNISALMSWWQHGRSHYQVAPPPASYCEIDEIGTRADLLSWLRRAHRGDVPFFVAGERSVWWMKNIAHFFKTVRILGDETPWEKVVKVLENEIDAMKLDLSFKFIEERQKVGDEMHR